MVDGEEEDFDKEDEGTGAGEQAGFDSRDSGSDSASYLFSM